MKKRSSIKQFMKGIIAMSLVIFQLLACPAWLLAGPQTEARKTEGEFRDVINILKKVSSQKQFTRLKPYVPLNDQLYWAECNSDVSFDLTFEEIIKELSKDSKDIEIHINENAQGGLIETVGWLGHFRYLYFQFTKENKGWKWLGVCRSKKRSLDFEISEKQK